MQFDYCNIFSCGHFLCLVLKNNISVLILLKKNCAYGLRILLIVFDYRHIRKTEVSFMDKEQKASIIRMRSDGMTFSEIANQLQLSINTVKSFYRRNAKTETPLEACMNCGKPIVQTEHKRQKKFCSDKCRNDWWSAHPQNRRPKKLYSHICEYCGIAFQSDRAKSKYCTVKCFADARRKENRI